VGKPPDWVDQVRLNMSVKAASLMVAVINADGKILHTKRVGLELMQRVEYLKHRNSEFSIVIEDNTPALSNHARVRSGIARSLKPFLPVDPPKAPQEASTNSADIE
jgi:hypothetical protein